MLDEGREVLAHYESMVAGEAARLAARQLERDMTRRYLETYLPPKGHILEIGAATGEYTLWLAERGHQVTAVDLSPSLIERCKQRLTETGKAGCVDCYVADARDLSLVPGKEFDGVLVMGPLYHLYRRTNRLQALREAVARLRPSGTFISALISRLGIMGELIRHNPAWIENQEQVRSILAKGHNLECSVEGGFHGYYVQIDEIAPLHEEAGLETILIAGVEPAISADDESYNRLRGTQRQLWLDLFWDLGREPALLAGSRHLLYIGRKPE
jgi:S-adenosylmethionine-dependent methyltransferase